MHGFIKFLDIDKNFFSLKRKSYHVLTVKILALYNYVLIVYNYCVLLNKVYVVFYKYM